MASPEKGAKRRKPQTYGDVPQASPEDTCIQGLSHILDRHVTLSSLNAPGRPTGSKELSLSVIQLPLERSSANERFQTILVSCTAREIDVLQYCVACYGRCSGAMPQSVWDQQVWATLATAAQDACASMTLQQLVEASSSAGGSNDLWSGLYGNETTNKAHVTFLDMLSGWSETGLQVSADMLHKMAIQAKTLTTGKAALAGLVRTGGTKLQQCIRLDELLMKESRTLDALDRLFTEPLIAELLADSLTTEIEYKNGRDFQTKSLLAGILSVSMVIDKLQLQSLVDKKYSCFVELRNFPNVSPGDIISCHSQLQDALHRCHQTVHTALLKMFKSPHKNTVLGWLAALVSGNQSRAGPRFRGQRGAVEGACSDGWMVNMCAVMLELSRPFFTSTPSGPKLPLIDRGYPSSPLCRLQLSNETCLAHGMIADKTTQYFAAGSTFKFVTELFFITQRALHVGLLPAVNQFTQTSSDLAKQLLATSMSTPNLKELNSLHMLAGTSSLLDPQLVQTCCQFYITQAVWITKQLEDCHGNSSLEAQVFSGLPEFCVKDMAVWFRFLVLGRPQLLQGLQLTPFVDCCVSLLERPDLLPSPLAQGRLVAVLLAFFNSDQRGPQRLLGSEGWGGILGELSVMVQASPSVQDKLGPALLHTYAAVNVVEGLDVDKENFDKFATRYEVAQLLLRLWTRDDCRGSILRQCGSRKFQSFLGAVLDTLLYQLGDALSRLTNVRKYEALKEGDRWSSLSDREKREKELFLAQEQRAAKGFMSQAALQLELFDQMCQTDPVVQCLLQPELAKRTPATMLGFLETLCGPKSSDLKVKEMDKYSFHPKKLVSQIASVLVRGWTMERGQRSPHHFVQGLSDYPEYSVPTMTKCAGILNMEDKQLATAFTQLTQQVETLQNSTHSASVTPPTGVAWQYQADSAEIDPDGLCELYVGALAEGKYDTAELADVHILADKLPPSLDPRSPKVKAILRDMKQMEESLPIHPDSAIFVRQDEDRMDLVRVLITGPTDTPYSRGAFVFDIMYPASYPTNPPLVFMTTTGGGTIRFNPNLYADGKVCLSLLGTWHGGDASEKWDPLRSNLLQETCEVSCGHNYDKTKSCIQQLSKSSFICSKVLLSIQGMIMIPDPMFNEPGYEAIRGTAEGNARSRQYNADIQVHTVRYAMLEQLRHPPKGLEDVIQVHFAIQQDLILKQLSQWLKDCISPEHERRLRKAVDEFRTELDKQ